MKKKEKLPAMSSAYKELMDGEVYLKYGAWGYPKQKHVFLAGKSIKWRANTKEGHKRIEKSTGQPNRSDKGDGGKAIHLTEGKLVIQRGRDNKIFKRFKVSKEDEELSFSIKIVDE